MKKLLTGAALLSVISMTAADVADIHWGNVPIIFDSYGHQVTRDGVFATGEAPGIESAWGRNNVTGEVYLYEACVCGDGNRVSSDYTVVGADKLAHQAAFLIPDDDPVIIESMAKYGESHANGITWDGTRIVGSVLNPSFTGHNEDIPEYMTMEYLPVYCDVDPVTGVPGEVQFLPVPPTDFFGLRPQYITASYISDDGHTILGQVMSNWGNYSYPIIFTENGSGVWDYSLPSEKLFNPNKRDLPVYPVPEMSEPDPVNYIQNEEFKKLFEEYWQQFLLGASTVNPYDLLNPEEAGGDALMTRQEWLQYQNALQQYQTYYEYVYGPLQEQYGMEMAQIIAESVNFLWNSMSMDYAGKLVGQTGIRTYMYEGAAVNFETPYLFDLEAGTYKQLANEYSNVQPLQIIPDGTVILVSPKPGPATPDLTPQHSYVMPAGTDYIIDIADYIKEANPDAYDWMKEYLYKKVAIGYADTGDELIEYKEMFVTGLVAVSDDFSTICGGVDGYAFEDVDNLDYFTYFLTDLETPDINGVEELFTDLDNQVLKVYNLQGVKVLETSDANTLNSLPKGIYVANGKKIFVR